MEVSDFPLILNAGIESLFMVAISLLFAIIFGIPIGIISAETRKGGVLENKFFHRIFNTVLNIVRSIPFIILLVSIIPFTRLIVGTSIGSTAAIVPLILYIVPFIARLIEATTLEVNSSIIDAARSMKANKLQIIILFILPEMMPGVILAVTNATIGLINASAMAGTVGGGGIGDLAITQGYQRFNTPLIFVTVIILIIIVNLVQSLGNYWANKIRH